MVELYNYGLNNLIGFPGKLNEGNLSITTINTVHGQVPGCVFTDEIVKGDYVKLTDKDLTFTKCEEDDPEVIGYVDSEPEFKGQQPTEAANWGDYEPRSSTVKLMGTIVKSVRVNDDNPEISVGDSVKLGAVGRFTKSTDANNTRVLQSAPHNLVK